MRERVTLGSALIMSMFLASALCAQDLHFVFDSNGNLTAQTAAIDSPPQIIGQPQNQVVGPGEAASFSVVAADARGLSYQWRFNGTDIAGATSEVLLLQNVGTGDEGQYSVVLVNSSGSVTSAPALLMLDTDADGMGDSWERTYFGSLTQYPTGDSDGDGISNGDEFLDGTDPTNPASVLFRLTLVYDAGVVTLTPARFKFTNGEIVTLTATAFAPHAFHGWGGDIDETNNPITLTITNNTTVFGYLSSYDIQWRAGMNGNWLNRTNWSPKFVPATNDNVFISQNVRVTNNTDVICRALTFGTVGGAGSTPSISGTGSITVYETCDWLSGTLGITGTTLVETGATLTASGSLTLANGTLHNRDTTIWTSGNVLLNNALIINPAGAVFEARGAGSLSLGSGTPRFDNAGTFRKSGSTGTTTVGANVGFNNSGRVEVLTGTLDEVGNGTHSGAFEVAAGATLSLAGIQTADAASSLSGAGNLTVRGGTLTLSGLVHLDGANSFISGTANLNGNYICTNSSATISGGTVNFNGTNTVGTLNLTIGSFLGGTNVLTILSQMNWSGGTMQGSGRTVILPGALLDITTSSSRTLNRTIENGGTILWSAGSVTFGGATITNRAGALFDQQTAVTTSVGGVNRFDNAGTFRKSVNPDTATWQMAFNNYGVVEIQTGRLALANGGTHTGTFDILAAASLNFSGGTHAADAAPHISGEGDLLVSGTATATFGGLVNPSGTHVFSGGTANLNGTYICTNNPVTISGGTVNFNGASTVGSVNLSNGTLGGTAVLTVMDTMNWSGGTMSGSGRTVIPSGASLNLINAGDVILNTRRLENGGTAIWTGSGSLFVNFAVITNRPGALFELRNNGTFSFQAGQCRFDNAGTFRKTVTAGTSTFASPVVFNNYGATEIQTGTLVCNGACTNNGAIALSAGTTLRLASGGFATGSFMTPSTALVQWTANTFTLNAGAELNGTGRYQMNGIVTVNANITVENLDVLGTLNGTGLLTVNNVMSWTSGTMSGSGRTRIASGATLNLNNAGVVMLQRTLENGGTAFWTGATITMDSAVITNRAGALFHAQNAATLMQRSGFNRFDNAGTFRKSGNTGTTTLTSLVSLNNYNTVEIKSGTIAANGGYTSTADALLNCAIGGITPGADYGRLQVAGTVNANGALSVDLVNSFVPAVNDSFSVLTAGTRTGSFANFFYPSNLVTMQLSNSPNAVMVRVTEVKPNVPPPTLLEPEIAGPNVRLTWTSLSNGVYRLESKFELSATNWNVIPGDIAASSNTVSTLEALTTSNRFYRVRVVQ